MAREPDVALSQTASGSQTNLSRLTFKYCKAANTSNKAFQRYQCRCIQVSNCSMGQVRNELKHFVVPCDTNAQLYGTQLLNIRPLRLSQLKRSPTPALE